MDRRMVEYEAKKQTPLVAYILLVVFGVVGAHNFYLGRRRQALAQRTVGSLNPGRKSRKSNQDCTICVSCFWTGPCWTVLPRRENRVGWREFPHSRHLFPKDCGSPPRLPYS
ncbi:TM2 domain-containing protein [Candidatus Palauibacter sp.]|uniref:TM2 domain-containing protein n=1 Tax=Candidatus Palauibacter sp. TaxID=3101350 RepID=UPI003B5B5470